MGYDRELQCCYAAIGDITHHNESLLRQFDFTDESKGWEAYQALAAALRGQGEALKASYLQHEATIDQVMRHLEAAPHAYRRAAAWCDQQAIGAEFSQTKKDYETLGACWRLRADLAEAKLKRTPLTKEQLTLIIRFIDERIEFLADLEANAIALPDPSDREIVEQFLFHVRQFGVYNQALSHEIEEYQDSLAKELAEYADDRITPTVRPSNNDVTVEPLVVHSVLSNCAIFTIPADAYLAINDVVQLHRSGSQRSHDYVVIAVSDNVVTVRSLEDGCKPTPGEEVLLSEGLPPLPLPELPEALPKTPDEKSKKKEARKQRKQESEAASSSGDDSESETAPKTDVNYHPVHTPVYKVVSLNVEDPRDAVRIQNALSADFYAEHGRQTLPVSAQGQPAPVAMNGEPIPYGTYYAPFVEDEPERRFHRRRADIEEGETDRARPILSRCRLFHRR